jgi:hypothetical protein
MNGTLKGGPAIDPFCLIYMTVVHISNLKDTQGHAGNFKP